MLSRKLSSSSSIEQSDECDQPHSVEDMENALRSEMKTAQFDYVFSSQYLSQRKCQESLGELDPRS